MPESGFGRGVRAILFDRFGEGLAQERDVCVVYHLELLLAIENAGKELATRHDHMQEEGKGENVHLHGRNGNVVHVDMV